LQKGDLKSSEAELREAVKLAPNDAVSLALLGMVLVRLERLPEAKGYLEKAVRVDPADSGTRYNLAAVQVRLGEPKTAKENIQRILRSKSDHAAAVSLGHEIALGEYRANRFAASQSTLEDLIATGARNAKVFNLLAWCYHRQNNLTEAVGAMKRAIELEPSVEINYAHLAQILLEQKKNVAAADVIQKALQLAPNSFQVYKLKGRMESQIGNFNLALASFTRAVELNDADAESLMGLALVQEKLFRFEQAAASFDKGIARFPRDPLFYQAYGRMLLEAGTKRDAAAESRAVSLLERALAFDDSLHVAHYELGKLLLGQGKAQASLPHLEAASKLNPRSGRIHLALANAYRSLERQDDSAKELRLFKTLQAQEEPN
jgi:tetratricopeptide (TPR) repeat protein